MGFKIKNSLTGEFEKLPILTLKGEKGETGGVEEYNKVDYMGNKYETLKQANDANVEYAVKTAIGEFNYLDYDGQHITATDTIEGQSKSAILKGQTLVNYLKIRNVTKEGMSSNVSSCPLKGNTKYVFLANVPTNTNNQYNFKYVYGDGTTGGDFAVVNRGVSGHITKIFTTPDRNDIINLNSYNVLNMTDNPMAVNDMMLIEYQEGMENWDISYFEGMQSVKMPVLKTTGKNLLNDSTSVSGWVMPDGRTEIRGALGSHGDYLSDFIYVGNINQIKVNEGSIGCYISTFDENKNFISQIATSNIANVENCSYIRVAISCPSEYALSLIGKLQVEEGSITTPYEPHKSNTLTTPEDLELRGIGKVKDELNVATGELTQRIGEIVLNGSEYWTYSGDHVSNEEYAVYNTKITTPINSLNIGIADKLVYDKEAVSPTVFTKECVYINSAYQVCYVRIKRQHGGIVNYLNSNPITIQYQLATESIKTVDLSDNHVYSYKDVTHYDCSSAEGSLVPTLSVKVPTDVQATIAQQRETIQTLNSENERLNQIQEALKASMLDSQVQLMNLSWNTDFEVFTLRESIAPKDFLLDSRTGSNIDKFSQAKFIIENDCPDLEKLNSQIEYYFSKDVFSQEQFEELTDLISIVKGENGCEY